MKRIMILVLMMITLGTVFAANGNRKYYNRESKYGTYSKGNISPEDLPESIKEYLNEEYSDCVVMISKLKNNGNYFVKIRYGGNRYRPYYRSLVFDYKGNIIKG